jgi:RNA polymerase sigma-70 factor, ECF subfamily
VTSVAPLFIAAAPPELDPRLRGMTDLEARLQKMFAAGAAAWPGVSLPRETFLRHVAERLPADADPAAALDALHVADLFLACACLAGDAAALAIFERDVFAEVARAVARTGAAADALAEAVQVTRVQLLVSAPGRPAAIAGYGGRGPLRGWLRVTLVRELVRAATPPAREVAAPELDGVAELDDSPEIAHLKRTYSADFQAAFAAATAGLGKEERALLRWHHVDRLSIDEIGVLLRVHRATAARRLHAARAALVEATRRELEARLKLARGELESILRLIESQVHVSVARLLGE